MSAYKASYTCIHGNDFDGCLVCAICPHGVDEDDCDLCSSPDDTTDDSDDDSDDISDDISDDDIVVVDAP